jgi:hypothetical protein
MKLDQNLRWAAHFCWLAAICAVIIGSLSTGNSSLMRAVGALGISDKVLHFAAYVLLAVLPVLGIKGNIRALAGAGSMVLVGLLLEVAQNFIPGRSPEVADEIANTLGVACGMALAFPFRPMVACLPSISSRSHPMSTDGQNSRSDQARSFDE